MDPSHWCEDQTQQCYPYAHFPPNPSAVTTAGAPAPAPTLASSHAHEVHTEGGAVGPPGVDAHAPNPYPPHEGYAVAYAYPPAVVGNYYQGYGGGDAQGFVVKDANLQHGVHPVAYVDVLGKLPIVSIYQNKVTHPAQNGAVWKKKKKIPKAMQSAYCEVCKIACNSQEVLNSHRLGKKHKKSLEKLKELLAPNPANAPTKPVEKKETPESAKDETGSEKTKKKPAPATEADLETKRRKVLEGGAAANAVKVCNLCNVVCNSEVVFSYHIAGQKHAAMVRKQQGAAVS